MNLEEFADDFREDVLALADGSGILVQDAFFEFSAEMVMSSGEVDDMRRAYYEGAKGTGIRVDGYGEDPLLSGTLDIIVLNYNAEKGVERLTATEMQSDFARAKKFIQKSLDEKWRSGLEETSPAFSLADMIAARWSRISKIRFFLLTNKILSERVDGKEAEIFEGKSLSFSVWDLRRFHALAAQGEAREIIDISLDDHGGPIAILPALSEAAEYQSFLAVVPASTLASIYDRWTARLLEQNVRVFLQARGSVNKGIRETLKSESGMFFAYNNGITATAQEIGTCIEEGTLKLTRLKDFQIVNGGQTTASIHAAMRAGIDLSRVSVQMKLSIVDPDLAQKIVPAISRFANTQNRVNAADFFSTDGLHVRVKELTERVFAPPYAGSFRQTKWFYERARGQAAEARSLLTPAQRRKFDLEHPRSQVFTKTDLAKFDMTFRKRPDVVSKGAQKCFAEYTRLVGGEWEKSPDSFNEVWFRNIVAKSIAFRAAERIVSNATWYTSGLRANTVTYALAKIAHDIDERGSGYFDLRPIWSSQALPDSLAEIVDIAAKSAHDHLLRPVGGSNPTEWAKKSACWESFSKLGIEYPQALSEYIMSHEDQKVELRDGRRDQKVISGIEAQTQAVSYGSENWQRARSWARQARLTSPKEDGILAIAGNPSKILSEQQALIAIEVLERLREKGFSDDPK